MNILKKLYPEFTRTDTILNDLTCAIFVLTFFIAFNMFVTFSLLYYADVKIQKLQTYIGRLADFDSAQIELWEKQLEVNREIK